MSEHYEIVHDIETLDTRHTAAVASIGAVCVRIHPDGDYEVVDTFYRRIEIYVQGGTGLKIYQNGRTVDQPTIKWWSTQHPVALAEIEAKTERHRLGFAMAEYSKWITQWPTAGLWGKGSDFDNAILGDCFIAHGREWPFRRNRCLRSLIATPELLNSGPFALPERPQSLIRHHALYDAQHESRELVALLHHLQGLTRR